MKTRISLLAVICMQLYSATVIDNRYFPWNNPPIVRSTSTYSGFTPYAFFVFADDAYGTIVKEKIGISEIWGPFDEINLSNALLTIGDTSPVLAEWQYYGSLPWEIRQRLEGQGLQLVGEHRVYKGLSVGYNTGFMRLFSTQLFSLTKNTIRRLTISPSQLEQLDEERRTMFEQLNLDTSQDKTIGLLDTVVYFRYGHAWDYQAKCKTVNLGIFGGVIIPTGVTRQYDNTASVPFGGNGATGFVIGTDDSFELKEDLYAGFYLQLTHRFKKTFNERMPIKGQTNFLFGAVDGPLSIDQGLTVKFRPYIFLGNLRDGFDVCLQYSFTHHDGDVWTDKRINPTIPSDLNGLYDKSEWMSDYVSLSLFYDSGRVEKHDSLRPVFRFSCDIPVKLLNAKDVSRTYAITFGLETAF